MSRLARTFAGLRRRGARALIPYFTAGDPSLAATRQLVLEAARRGADVVELGVPSSRPLAAGPVTQRASQRALAAGVSLARVLELAREARREVTIPIVLLTYYNPVPAFGLQAFALAPGGGGGGGRGGAGARPPGGGGGGGGRGRGGRPPPPPPPGGGGPACASA